MKNKNSIIIATIVIATFGILGWAIAQLGGSADITMTAAAQVATQERAYDWGTIDMDDGMATKQFEITNSGTEPLQLYNVTTSCTCTTAQLISEGQRSPLYSMHTKSKYVHELAPGETAQLEVVFNPAFHGPSGVGAITRQVTVETNNPQEPALNFVVSADVIK